MTIMRIVLKRVGGWLQRRALSAYEFARSWFVERIQKRSDRADREKQE